MRNRETVRDRVVRHLRAACQAAEDARSDQWRSIVIASIQYAIELAELLHDPAPDAG
jgi:hypothetical protein